MKVAEPDDLAAFAAARDGDADERARLAAHYDWVAAHVARRYSDRGEPFDDLLQVGRLGLLKAIDRFDPEIGTNFVSFAMPTVIGEVQRWFRDQTWTVRVPRRAKELRAAIQEATEQLTRSLARSPRVHELAAHLGIAEEEVLEGLEAAAAYRTASIEHTFADGSSADVPSLGRADAGYGHVLDQALLRQLLERLPERERRILYLRFFEELSQSEIAEIVGTSQVHVSRLLTKTIERLRVLATEN